MMIFVMDLEKGRTVYDIEEGMLVSQLKDLIAKDWRFDHKSFKLFHKQKKLEDYTLLTSSLLGSDPTLVIFDETMYIQVEDHFIPSIYNQNPNELDETQINFIIRCSKHPRFEEMMNLFSLFPTSVTFPFITQIMKRIDDKEIDESIAPAVFCSALKQSIRFNRTHRNRNSNQNN